MPDWNAYVRERLRLNGIKADSERDVIDDLAQQLEDAYREAIARGLSDVDAAAAAQAHITDWPALARQVAGSRRFVRPSAIERLEVRATEAAASGNRQAGLLAGILHDIRFAARLARRAPGFTAVAVLTLAHGIGANSTIFSWINAVLLDPIPGAETKYVVDVSSQTKNTAYSAMSYPDFMELRSAVSPRIGLIVHDMTAASLAGESGAERIWVEVVSDNFFDVLGVTPAAGRGFLPAEGRASVPVVMISERLARRRFGDSEKATAQPITINGSPFTVVGVVPADFSSGYTGLMMDAWLPIPVSDKVLPGGNRTEVRANHWLNSMARLEPGMTTAQASAELTDHLKQITRAAGGDNDIRVNVVPLWRSPRGAQSILGPVLLVLMSLVAIVLLIACANIANLLLSRASARRREFALRLSLGCSRARLIRQLLTEALMLVSVAAIAAAVAQLWTVGLLTKLMPPNDLPIGLTYRFDARVTVFIALVAFASALIFGLAPALQAGRTDLVDYLKGGMGQAIGGRRSRLRNVLVVSQVALSLLLLASAGLFIRSLENARVFDTGFKTDNVLLSSINLFSAEYDRARSAQVQTRILDDIRALPGVESVSLARRVPLGISTGSSSTDVEPEGYTAPKGDEAWAYLNWVGPDYFKTMSIRVNAGREFTTADRPDEPEVFVVNQTFVDRYWPGQNPIGKRVRFAKEWYIVAGVVADSKYKKLNEPASPFVYLSTTWNYRPDVTLHVRCSGDPLLLADSVREVVNRAAPGLPVFGVMTLADHVRSASFQQRLAAWLLSAFGALALLLASLGLYATMAYSVSRRTRELGARLALGATRADITRLVLGQALRVTGVGVVIGVTLAGAAAPLFSSLLVGVRPLDPMTFVGVTILLSSIALVASYVPARRAARLDPLQALRWE